MTSYWRSGDSLDEIGSCSVCGKELPFRVMKMVPDGIERLRKAQPEMQLEGSVACLGCYREEMIRLNEKYIFDKEEEKREKARARKAK